MTENDKVEFSKPTIKRLSNDGKTKFFRALVHYIDTAIEYRFDLGQPTKLKGKVEAEENLKDMINALEWRLE